MIAAVFEALVSHLSAVPGIAQVMVMPKRLDTLTLPALVIDVGEFAYGLDAGTAQLPLVVHWEARLLVPDAVDDLTLWSLVEAVMQQLYVVSWSTLTVGPVILKQATPDAFSPEVAGYRVWLIEWAQALRVGDNPWDAEGVVPQQVTLRYAGADDMTVTLAAVDNRTTTTDDQGI